MYVKFCDLHKKTCLEEILREFGNEKLSSDLNIT